MHACMNTYTHPGMHAAAHACYLQIKKHEHLQTTLRALLASRLPSIPGPRSLPHMLLGGVPPELGASPPLPGIEGFRVYGYRFNLINPINPEPYTLNPHGLGRP